MMVELDPVWQNVISAAFAVAEVGGGIVLFIRGLAKQREYLRRFPPVNGIPLDALVGGNPLGARSRTIWRVMQQRQSDPDAERLRREVWVCLRYVNLWIFGFPLLFFGVVALLIVTGVVQLLP